MHLFTNLNIKFGNAFSLVMHHCWLFCVLSRCHPFGKPVFALTCRTNAQHRLTATSIPLVPLTSGAWPPTKTTSPPLQLPHPSIEGRMRPRRKSPAAANSPHPTRAMLGAKWTAPPWALARMQSSCGTRDPQSEGCFPPPTTHPALLLVGGSKRLPELLPPPTAMLRRQESLSSELHRQNCLMATRIKARNELGVLGTWAPSYRGGSQHHLPRLPDQCLSLTMCLQGLNLGSRRHPRRQTNCEKPHCLLGSCLPATTSDSC